LNGLSAIQSDHFPREILLRGGPLDGRVMYAHDPIVRYARQVSTAEKPRGYITGEYINAGRWVHIRWDLPDDGSLLHPDVFMTGKGRLIMDVRVFDWAGEDE
jgi:hypothetical protein